MNPPHPIPRKSAPARHKPAHTSAQHAAPPSRNFAAGSETQRLTTEQKIVDACPLDSLDAQGIVKEIHAQDSSVAAAVGKELPQIARAVEAATQALRRGGRVLYVGAGTSGRLGALDAAECPPTFGVAPEKFQAVIAGGPRALLHAAEAAEDNAAQGARDMVALRVGPRDVVIGLSASGRTPYTVGAVRKARSRRAVTVAIACNPGSALERAAHIGIIPLTGPEILSGSTRLKAGLAQKMILQMISTATMARLGHVYRNYMVGVRPTNEKLVARASGIIASITGVSTAVARTALAEAGNDVRTAIVMLTKGLPPPAASRLLKRYDGDLRKIL